MKKMKERMDESILVCVYYGPNGERLIQRGCKIANMLDCPLYILTVDPKPFDELDAEKSNYIAKMETISFPIIVLMHLLLRIMNKDRFQK